MALTKKRESAIVKSYNGLDDKLFPTKTSKIKELLRRRYKPNEIDEALPQTKGLAYALQQLYFKSLKKDTILQMNNYVDECIEHHVLSGKKITDKFILSCKVKFLKDRHKRYKDNLSKVESRIISFRNQKEIKKQIDNEDKSAYNPDEKIDLGFKNESYWISEEQMIAGYIAPDFNDLSYEEQEIWRSLDEQ